MTGQLNPLIPATEGKSKKFFEHVKYMRCLPVPWASSVITDNDHQTYPEDLEWLTWGAIGAGSHGVFLTAHEKDSIETIAECEKKVKSLFEEIKSLRPLSGISVPVELECNTGQEGIHVDFLACGADHILAIILNEWSTRSCFQESEPFMAAIRKDVKITFSLGNDWAPAEIIDPIRNCPISHTRDSHGQITMELPCFDNVQVVRMP